jgi:hypothetical protein
LRPETTIGIDPSVAHFRARVAALVRWSAVADPTAETAPARSAFLGKFEAEVDPDGKLPDAERTRRALIARRAYMARLSLLRATANSKKKAARTVTVQAASCERGADNAQLTAL